jgi:tetratricopeptide (TPR) repeat protein
MQQSKDLSLRQFRGVLRDLRAPERLRHNPLLRRLLPGVVSTRDLDDFRRGVELNLERLPERQHYILLHHDIRHTPANETWRSLYISPRQFSVEHRRALTRLFEYIVGELSPRLEPNGASDLRSGARQLPLRETDILEVLRPNKSDTFNPVMVLLGRVSKEAVSAYLSRDAPKSSKLHSPGRERQIIRALVKRLTQRERQVLLRLVKGFTVREISYSLKLSVRHTLRLRKQSIAALREALLQLEVDSQMSETRTVSQGPYGLALPLARSLLQAGAYAGALHVVEDAVQRSADKTERLILNVEAADIELHAQLVPAATNRLRAIRQLLKMDGVPSVVAGPSEMRTSTLEAFLSPDYFAALEGCEQALLRFGCWLSEHGWTRESSIQVIWLLCCIAEIARIAGLSSRARSAVLEAEQLIEQWSLQHTWIAWHLRLQRSCADVALFGSIGDALQSLSVQFYESSDQGLFANTARIALCLVEFNSLLGRHADATHWASWLSDYSDRLSPLDRINLALNSADALTRCGRARDALVALGPYIHAAEANSTAPLAPVDLRVAEALVQLSHPREALAASLRALQLFDRRRAQPNLARAHAVAAQCYAALESTQEAMAHREQSQSLAERFASPAQLLHVYEACVHIAQDRRLEATMKEMRHIIGASTVTASGRLPELKLPQLSGSHEAALA